ncbi:hypothetical protein DID88_002652 [Monilinia fructigena]|uniref:Uncharacterized protein n=1 Tax=Monilinia fructigena TaxID=38457 RepID=A0A395IRE1_9HELO|nr:hypothetical protein DID88_002652 [Monilinia fructigena]
MASTQLAPVKGFYQEPTAHQISSQSYFIGVRGFIVLQSFLWTFLNTLVPTAVTGSPNSGGPVYQQILRKVLSVLFWNESLIYSAFILLSARTICTPFLNNPSHDFVASSSFRRGLRLWFPSAFSLAIIYIVFTCIGTSYIDDFKTATNNTTVNTPYMLPNALAYFNSVFNLFWTNKKFERPGCKLCVPHANPLGCICALPTKLYYLYDYGDYPLCTEIVESQSIYWICHNGMVGRKLAWYSITGLLLADLSLNMDFMPRHGQEFR